MKLAGKELRKSNSHLIVIPRDNDDPIVLTAHAVLDYSMFDKLCEEPKPPIRLRPGGEKVANYQDPRFLLARESYARRKIAWIVLESLRLGSPELEWDTVDMGDPNTWDKYEAELKESGFNQAEIMLIVDGCFIANSLSESKLEEARASFLASQEEKESQSLSPEEEAKSTPSGEAVSV